jgi:diacylglycerol kinase (ATP)
MQMDKFLKTKPFSLRARANSFRFAWNGIHRFFLQEHNAWIHLVATMTVFLSAYWFGVSRQEMVLLIIVTGFVWVAEIFNTAIEKMMDFVAPGYHPRVKLIKDLAAAGVLVASLIALATGAFIFIPKIF